MTARHVRLQNTAIGLASKDESEVHIEDVRIRGSEVGVTLYQKKPEFGPAAMNVQGLEMAEVTVPFLIEKDSDLSVDGKRIAPNRTKVKDDLYGKRFGRPAYPAAASV